MTSTPANEDGLRRAIENYLQALMQNRQDSGITEEEIARTMLRVREFNEAFQDLEQSLLEIPEVQTISQKLQTTASPRTLDSLKQDYLSIHTELLNLLGPDYSSRPNLYSALPQNSMDRVQYQAKLEMAEQEELSAKFKLESALQSPSSKFDVLGQAPQDQRIKSAYSEYNSTIARIKSGVLHFLETVTPIDAEKFRAKLHALLDKKTAVLKEVRTMQMQGVDVGDFFEG